MGIDRVHQVEDLGFIHGNADMLRHVALFQNLSETLHGLLGDLHVQGVALGGREDDDNAALRSKLLVNFLILTVFLAVGQELSDVLLIAHPRGEEGEQGGQHHSQRDGKPAPFLQEIVNVQKEICHHFTNFTASETGIFCSPLKAMTNASGYFDFREARISLAD